MYRTFDKDGVSRAASLYPPFAEDFDAAEFLANKDNVAVTDGLGNYMLFFFEYPGAYQGHFFFENAKGRDAILRAQEAISLMFNAFDAKLIFGLVQVQHRRAIWLTRKIGFQPQGILDTRKGPCEMFTMTKDEYEEWAV